MTIVVVGLNHRTAPVELREQLALADCGLQMALEELQIQNQGFRPGANSGQHSCAPTVVHEAAILSTCNRLEIYAVVAGEAVDGWAAIESFLVCLQGIPTDQLHPHLYFLDGQTAIKHLMRVAAGLDSLILGEPQVLGQVADAYRTAQAAGTTGPILSHLFAQAIHAGKRARAETEISRYTTSVSHAAALLAQNEAGKLDSANVLLIGAGEMALLAAQALRMHGARELRCINRTFARAEELAKQVDAHALNWYHLGDALTWADVVVTATSAPHTILYSTDVAQILPRRSGNPLVVIDIAVPRDVEETVGELPGVRLHDIDDLEGALDANLAHRQAAIPQVESIVGAEVAGFLDWLKYRQVAPVIVDLRRKAESFAQTEVQQALHRMKDLSTHDREVVERMAYRIVNKLLHEPTMQLKAQAASGNGYGYAHVIRELFMLGDPAVHENAALETYTDLENVVGSEIL